MREIKFRAWNGKVMVEGIPLTTGKLIDLHHISNVFFRGIHTEADHEDGKHWTLMQYTGLHDKNGKEIYEGDVVKAFLGKIAVVKFGDYMVNGADFYSNYATAGFYIDYGNNDDSTSYIKERECEVIGNIWESPELLK